MTDTIRILRIYEFVGPRNEVESQVAQSIQGSKILDNGIVITAATMGTYPEVLTEATMPDTEAQRIFRRMDLLDEENRALRAQLAAAKGEPGF
jgi:hypothetical protein